MNNEDILSPTTIHPFRTFDDKWPLIKLNMESVEGWIWIKSPLIRAKELYSV